MTVSDNVLALAKKHFEQIRTWRRSIHKNPELSFKESATAKLVAAELKEMGYEVATGVGGTGVTAQLGKNPSVGIRADMDALPIEEDNSLDYCSQNKGVMHACGHDAHTACGLGAARILADLHASGAAGDLPTKVKFLFQPAEECTNSDGLSGASMMMKDGAIKGLSGVVGLHVFPSIPTGVIGLREGPLLAACDTFDIKIHGKGSHGAFPQDGIDAIVLASQAVQAIQTIMSRRKSALTPCVLTVGGMRSLTYAPNIVAECVEMTGTARYFHNEMSALVKEELERALGIVTAMGGSYELAYKTENPPLVNGPAMTEAVRRSAENFIGKEHIIDPGMQMGAEDFSFYCQHTSACFIVLGARIEGDERVIHTPRFDIDENALPLGAALLTQSALEFLRAK